MEREEEGRVYLESLVEVVDEANPLSCLLGEASGLGLKGLGLLFKLPLIREYFYYSSYGDMSTSFLSLLPLPSFSLVPLMHICTPQLFLRGERKEEKRERKGRGGGMERYHSQHPLGYSSHW